MAGEVIVEEVMCTMTVELSAAPNPDFRRGSHRGSIRLRPRHMPVSSLKDASALCRMFIEEHELGGGNWTGGEVRDLTGAPVARVSYNGRCWMPGEWTSETEEIELEPCFTFEVEGDLVTVEVEQSLTGAGIAAEPDRFTARGTLARALAILATRTAHRGALRYTRSVAEPEWQACALEQESADAEWREGGA